MVCQRECGTPLGKLLLTEQGEKLISAEFMGAAEAPSRQDASPLLRAAAEQLEAYFAGVLRQFDLPLAPKGTAFQLRVWQALLTIPYGSTVTYGQLAETIMLPGGARAVGQACNRNPIGIFAPCHRVVGAGGRLTGYAGGLEKKAFLLRLEGAAPDLYQ